MTIIDQRILIPANPEVVWEIVSDINNNPRWQVDCQSISFLTSLRAGPGMRWRYTSPGGQEFVVETTAWYNQLGYEYTFIDGAPFRSSKGTIRLQEIAEGTIVQWTLNYEVGGMLGGMRNTLSVRRQFSSVMEDSLKGLWSFIKESGKGRQSHEAKSLMRDALDYEARAQYTPRHPSRVAERESQEETGKPVPVIDEPPVADEDTRPNPALVTEAEAAAPTPPETPPPPAADKPNTDEWKLVTEEPDLARFQRPPVPEPPMPLDTPSKPIEPIQLEPITDAQSEPEPEKAVLTAEAVPPETPVEPAPTAASSENFGPKLDTSKLDTREISIWEVFGVLSPSDTERMKAITDKDLAETVQADGPEKPVEVAPEIPEEAPRLPPEATRPIAAAVAASSATMILASGFRINARRRQIKLRHRI